MNSGLISRLEHWLDHPSVIVHVAPADEIVKLREEVQRLNDQEITLRMEVERLQGLYQTEVNYNLRLQDELKFHGIHLR